MIASGTVDGENLHRRILREHCLAVFHGQNVIGLTQQTIVHAHGLQSLRSGGGEGDTGVQSLTKKQWEPVVQQSLSRFCQLFFFTVLRSKAECVTEPGQQVNTPSGEPLRRRQGRRHRQLHHQICPAEGGGFCPDAFIKQGGFAPLDEIAAHGADDRRVLPQFPPDALNLMQVPQMKGVIFADNANNHEKIPPFLKNILPGT